MKHLLIVIVLAALFIFACEKTPNEAPYTHNSGIEGTITFENGTPDSIKANVQVINQSYGLVIDETNSNETGVFQFSELPPATYQLNLSANNYQDLYVQNVSLDFNEIYQLGNIQMQIIKPVVFLEVIVDGMIDAEWHPVYANTNDSNWSTTNDFQLLYLARDNENLYIALDVTCESANSVNLYLDIDYGSNTGLNDFTSVSQGIADGRLYKEVTAPSNFGADVGLCVWGGSNKAVFNLQNGNDLNANAIREGSILEVAIPFSELYNSGIAPVSGKIAIVALIGGGAANSMSNDTIPQQSTAFGTDGNRHFSTVFSRQY
jgi:hypothetical protein